MSIEWYAVHTYVGQERMVEKNLKERASKMGMWYTKIYQVLQPSETATEMRRTTSSSVSISGAGSQSRPSAGMQYEQRRLQRSVSETRRSVATRP